MLAQRSFLVFFLSTKRRLCGPPSKSSSRSRYSWATAVIKNPAHDSCGWHYNTIWLRGPAHLFRLGLGDEGIFGGVVCVAGQTKKST